ncbi:gluconate 2-dehydrogenase subunit 3 family protein [Lujinxingia sediminis]|nr:gluconate 2-dehydrogenase subunit 3 family protein [Lujinxingia sediminis]
MRRRTFLKVSVLGVPALALSAGTARVGLGWYDQPASPPMATLSAREVEICEAICDALYPGDHLGMPPGNEVGVVQAVDAYLSAIPEDTANLLRLLLHAIDDVGRMATLPPRAFHRRSRRQRQAILRAWDTSSFGARQDAFKALKMIFAMGYCEAPEVIRAAGIDYTCGDWQ